MRTPHFLLFITAAQISEKFIFKDAFKRIIFDHSATPFNRIYHGTARYIAAFYLMKLSGGVYQPNMISAAFNHWWMYTGTADIVGGIKDTIFLTGRVLSTLKLPNYESKKVLSTSLPKIAKEKLTNPRPFAKKKTFVPYQVPKPSTRNKYKQDPSQNSFIGAEAQQHTYPMFAEESYTTTAILPTWREERQQLLNHGITIEPGPYGETILRCGDVTKTITTPHRDEAKISGKKAETIRSMFSITWENISNAYSVATLAMHADLNPHHYVFKNLYKHYVISVLENCKSDSDVSLTRNDLINLLKFLDTEERQERKSEIRKDQDLGYYFDTRRGHGSHAMYSLGRGMGGITLCEPKNGRNPDDLTPEQVKDLKKALIQKGAMKSNS